MGAAAGAAQVGIGGLQILEAKNQADALKRQASFNARQMEFNAELVGMQKSEVEKLAKKDIAERESQVKQMVGEQKAAYAGQGVDLDSEVVGLVEDQERQVGLDDVQSIKNNAWRAAMGLEIEMQDRMNGAQLTRIEGAEAARSTFVSGALGGVSSMIGGASNISKSGGFGLKKSKKG